MISKAHIISFLIIAGLYAAVAIWKIDSSSANKNGFDQQLSDNPSTEIIFWNHYNKANQHRSDQQYLLAAEEYQQALEANSHHKDALYYAGSMHLLLKDFQQTKKYWDRLLEEEPNAPRIHLQLGTLYVCMDRNNEYLNLDKAVEHISTAWQLNREETGAPLLLAKIAILKSELETSKEILDNVLATDESSIEALFLTGYIHWSNGNNERAQKLLSKAKRKLQMQTDKILDGEGNTETGARAMLSEDRFCDAFEPEINKLLTDREVQAGDKIYVSFDNTIRSWKAMYEIS